MARRPTAIFLAILSSLGHNSTSQVQIKGTHYQYTKIAESGSVILDSTVSNSIWTCFLFSNSTTDCHVVTYDRNDGSCVLLSRDLLSSTTELMSGSIKVKSKVSHEVRVSNNVVLT